MLEIERGSIISYILSKTGLTRYYTDKLPKSFAYPAVYFPTPEIDTSYDTLSSYSLHYRMPVRFFSADNQTAYDFALKAANSLIAERNRIPLREREAGAETGACFKIKGSEVRKIETGVYGFNIEWDSFRTFDDIPDDNNASGTTDTANQETPTTEGDVTENDNPSENNGDLDVDDDLATEGEE